MHSGWSCSSPSGRRQRSVSSFRASHARPGPSEAASSRRPGFTTRPTRSSRSTSSSSWRRGRPGRRRVVLGPRETRRVDDPVGSLFGLDSAAGTLTARADRPFLLRGVTANVADPRGTYGLALPALRETEALRPGETGTAPWLTHTSAAGTGSRTNVAVALLEPGTEAHVTIVDDTGLVRGEKRLVAADALFWQQSVTELASDAEIPLGRVEVRVLRGSAVAYTAVVDNVTGDGLLALARRVETPAAPPYVFLFPGAARVPGANGTLWRTGLRLVNPGLDPVEVTLEVPGGSARSSRLVPPRGAVEEPDLLGALGYPEGSAAPVRVIASRRLSVLAATRNVDPSGRPGTFAASQEPTPEDALAGPGTVPSFTGLSADSGTSGFRTNVAFVGGPAGASGRLLSAGRVGRADRRGGARSRPVFVDAEIARGVAWHCGRTARRQPRGDRRIRLPRCLRERHRQRDGGSRHPHTRIAAVGLVPSGLRAASLGVLGEGRGRDVRRPAPRGPGTRNRARRSGRSAARPRGQLSPSFPR